MKNKIIIFILAIAFHATLTGCSELDTENVSKITYYPIITLTGDQWMVVPKGGSYSEPGVKATEDGKEIPVVTAGDAVDTSTPGVYTIKYIATNKDGFAKIEYRYVGVISPDVAGIDISGKYKRDAGAGGVSTVTKIKDNLFSSDNVGGVAVPGPSTTVYFYFYDTETLGVPYQLVQGSPFYCEDATIDVGTSYSWVVINGGYGTALRNFVKL